MLLDLYDDMHDQPVPVAVDSLWASLGVARRSGDIVYDDGAALAGIRRALAQ